jgi:putative flippase GtrA
VSVAPRPGWHRRVGSTALPVLMRLVRFGLVGAAATATHAIVALAALRGLGFPPLFAHWTGFGVAFVASFCGHSLFTFRAAMSWPRAVRFTAVALSTAALSSLLVLAAQAWTPVSPELYLPAIALLTPVLNFVCHSLWTFRRVPGIVD